MTTFWICSAIAAAAPLAAETVLRLERRRIAAEIQARGGRLVEIVWRGFERARFQDRRGRAYDVLFDDRAGRRHRARLLMTLFARPVWLEDHAAGLFRSAVAEGRRAAKGPRAAATSARTTARLHPRTELDSRAA
ncbi:MAG: hypothetical protein KIS92_19390 [Planctomycetota bacterium]|nr:hypothetical protein [Planctomycetota bacterium]